MPKLDLRLKTVAQQIRTSVHVDIGSDHGHLLVALLASGRIERGIAIENKPQPFENSLKSLANCNAEVRYGDGLCVLQPGEAESLSICGMGAESIVRILEAFPDRIPPRVILQPNRQPDLVRRWALRSGFHVVSEHIARGHWPYVINVFDFDDKTPDPAYEGIDLESALLFGPLILKQANPEMEQQLIEEVRYLESLDRLEARRQKRLELMLIVLREVFSSKWS